MDVGENAWWVDDSLGCTDCNAAIRTAVPWMWNSGDPSKGCKVINVNVVKPRICHILAANNIEMVGRHSGEVSIARAGN